MTIIDGGGAVTGTTFGSMLTLSSDANPKVADFWSVAAGLAVSVVGDDVVLNGAAVEWTAQPGDANLDGKVDVFDLAVLANNYGAPGPKDWQDADFDLNDAVNVFDLAVLANNYGYGGGTGEPIPEPAGFAMLMLGTAALLRKRR